MVVKHDEFVVLCQMHVDFKPQPAGEDARINRIVSTRNISKDLAKNIIKNQTTDDERIKRADYVAINDGTRKDLYEQAKNIIKRIFE